MTEGRAMCEVSHANPYTGETFGAALVFRRGATVAADGGRRPGRTMRDLTHRAPHGEGADRAFERGTEGRSETV